MTDEQLVYLGVIFRLLEEQNRRAAAEVLWDLTIATEPGSWARCGCNPTFLALGLLKLNNAGDGYDVRGEA